MAMFETVLVANRGEIAVRVMRTLRQMGIRSVGVYSDEDAHALHVREADIAVRLGPAPAVASYLSVEQLLRAADATGSGAIHPGYGFLAEHAGFAEACREAGLVFIGPPSEAIATMGDKIRAKRTVVDAGVPVVPGRTDSDMTDEDLVAAADEVGYPVLVKPSAGGGGKGMRLVHDPGDLPRELASARREAHSSFGDDTLFVERFVLRPRHIEVQLLADGFGSVVSLGERECSLQRRHQKIIEETPSVLLTETQRAAMADAAKQIARAVRYEGVGTVEFIVSADSPGDFFFMEMNTRLQVEHPVTELVTGLDLVEQQIRVAGGEPLTLTQEDVQVRGHAVEARIYAENPASGFVPSGGDVHFLREAQGEGIRVDTSLYPDCRVGTTYDPMISKVAAWGPDRRTAVARLDRALAETVVLGFETNINFLRLLLRHPDVRSGDVDTELVERELSTLVARPAGAPACIAAALHALSGLSPEHPAGDDLWGRSDGWRFGGAPAPTSFTFTEAAGPSHCVQVSGTPSGAVVVVNDGPPLHARIEILPVGALLTVEGTTTHAVVVGGGGRTWVWIDGASFALVESSPQRRTGAAGSADNEVRSPMPGTVLAVHVKAGAHVEEGEALLIVEAMKMEYTLSAPRAGRVARVEANVGDQVLVDATLVELEPAQTGGADA
jgi:acetyl-CoA/propionyl-CoA carboxylase, biotin carboxylase, biotin carboxyl carrier protein